MSYRDRRPLIAIAILIFVAVAAKPVMGQILKPHAARGGFAGLDVTSEIRAASLRFGPNVSPGDQAWILAAIANARPEAQRLIAEVDGLVVVDTDLNTAAGIQVPQAIGLAQSLGDHVEISVDVHELDGERAIDRNMVVLHELGHVIDFALVDDALIQQLDSAIPPSGPCTAVSDGTGGCARPEERFADTFAKWALRGRFSLAGSGYGVPTPPSLEDWGMPLGSLAAALDVNARR
jgi:hypothetical protein